MKLIHTTVVALLLSCVLCGCAKHMVFTEDDVVEVYYSRFSGEGGVKDEFRLSNETVEFRSKYVRKEVVNWIYRVPQSTNRQFLRVFGESLEKNRLMSLGSRKSSTPDGARWSLSIRIGNKTLDIELSDITRPGVDEHAPWTDQDLTSLRNFVSDMRLAAELYAVKVPYKLCVDENP